MKKMRNRNHKKKQTEILELKHTTTELRTSTESFNIRHDQAEKESVNLKSDHLKLSSQRKKKTNNKNK